MDPRERFPDLADHFTDEAISAWQITGCCLCGCGEITGLEHGRGPGRSSCFKSGHASRLRKQLGLSAIHKSPKSHKFYQALRQNNLERSVDAAAVMELLEEWCWENGISLWEFSRRYGFSEGILYHNLRGVKTGKGKSGGRQRIYKTTAAKILDIIGEPLNADVRKHLKDTTKGRRS